MHTVDNFVGPMRLDIHTTLSTTMAKNSALHGRGMHVSLLLSLTAVHFLRLISGILGNSLLMCNNLWCANCRFGWLTSHS